MPTMTVPSAAGVMEISRNRSKAPLAPTGGVVAKNKKPSPPAPRSKSTTKPSSPAKIGKGAQVRVRTRVRTVCTGQRLVLWLRAVVESAADEDADGCLRVAYDFTNGKFPRVACVSPNDVKLHVVVPPADADASGSSIAASSAAGSFTAASDHSARTSASLLSQQDKAAPAPPPRPTVAGKKLPLLKKLEQDKAAPAPPPRPTGAGKKLPLLKKLEKEMLMSSSKAIMGFL